MRLIMNQALFRPALLLPALLSVAGCAVAAPGTSMSHASITFPANSGVLNVRDARFGA
jgi:hypothetical protein